jgi:hypothetical protein
MAVTVTKFNSLDSASPGLHYIAHRVGTRTHESRLAILLPRLDTEP